MLVIFDVPLVLEDIDEDGLVYLTKEFHYAIEKDSIEAVSGAINNNEKPLDSAKRELLEETGYQCKTVTYVGSHRVSPCRLNSHVHVFVGQGAQHIDGKKNEKNIEAVLVSEEEFNKRGADSGKGKDLIELFFQQKKDSPNDCYSYQEMLHEFLTFFAAGMDTTGHLLTMASYFLLKHPEYLKKA